MHTTKERIEALKKSRNAVILAHYYVPDEVQELADYVGDSFYLAKVAQQTQADSIVFCGVHFMGESAKILNPEKRVFLPDPSADCPMAHMAAEDQIGKLRAECGDLAVVCYINSTARLKSLSDVCVTSSNAVKIVKSLPQKNILFIPDQNLGSFVAAAAPEKTFYYSGGYCPVHAFLLADDVAREKRAHASALVLTHPECTREVRALSDYVGSTAGIISYAEKSDAEEFIVCTEPGVLYKLKKRCPKKKFYPVSIVCGDMKKITPERVAETLEKECGEVFLDGSLARKAYAPLARMLELG